MYWLSAEAFWEIFFRRYRFDTYLSLSVGRTESLLELSRPPVEAVTPENHVYSAVVISLLEYLSRI
jgi:hypothetical protein